MSLAHDLLALAVEHEASDIHLKAGASPHFRIRGRLRSSELPPLDAAALRQLVNDLLPAHLQERSRSGQELDFSHHENGVGRFRVNVFIARGVPTVAFRYVKTRIPTIEELSLPPILEKLALADSGILLIGGATSTGKSTTLAALLDCINRKQRCRIITVEDPVEYIFTDNQSVITQREIGLDTASFQSALKHVIRQDPDVIMIGEMRDAASMAIALSAAETGHLVLSTLHVNSAAQSVHRMLDFFPHAEREQARLTLAATLRAALCQRLIPLRAGGVRAAVEILINTPTVRKLILENKLEVLPAAVETGTEDGMQTFNQALLKLVRDGLVSEEMALTHSPAPEQLRMNLQGIFLDEGRRILGH